MRDFREAKEEDCCSFLALICASATLLALGPPIMRSWLCVVVRIYCNQIRDLIDLFQSLVERFS